MFNVEFGNFHVMGCNYESIFKESVFIQPSDLSSLIKNASSSMYNNPFLKNSRILALFFTKYSFMHIVIKLSIIDNAKYMKRVNLFRFYNTTVRSLEHK